MALKTIIIKSPFRRHGIERIKTKRHHRAFPVCFPESLRRFRDEKRSAWYLFFFFAMKLGNDRRFCDTIKKEIKKKNSILIVKRGVMVVIGKGKRQFASRSRGGKKKRNHFIFREEATNNTATHIHT